MEVTSYEFFSANVTFSSPAFTVPVKLYVYYVSKLQCFFIAYVGNKETL